MAAEHRTHRQRDGRYLRPRRKDPGSETQKDQTNQVATAMQEMSSTVLQVVENSNKAAESAKHSGEMAREGGHIVSETIKVVKELATSTRRHRHEDR